MENALSWPGLEPGTAAEIGMAAIPRRWRQNAILFRRGESCNGIHFLQSGLVKLYVGSRAGREQIFHLVSNAEPLTITPLIDDGPYAVGACALIESRTLFLERDAFERFYCTRPDFARAVCLHLTKRLRETVTITHAVTLKPLGARVAWHILEQARTAGVLETGVAFAMATNQTEIARLLCATRESIARALSALRGAGIIEQRGPRIRILRLDALADCANRGEPPRSTPMREQRPQAGSAELRLPQRKLHSEAGLLA